MPLRMRLTISPPRLDGRRMNPFSNSSQGMRALEASAEYLMSAIQTRFGKMEADKHGNLTRVKPLAKVTLEMAEGRAKKLVGKGATIRQPTSRRKYPLAVGKGAGVQKTARVRRYEGSIPLVDTGTLRVSLRGGVGHVRRKEPFSYTILIGTNIRYAYILHEGATIPVTEELRKRLGMETGVWFNVGTKLKIPPRRFLLPSKEEVAKAAEVFIKVLGRLQR